MIFASIDMHDVLIKMSVESRWVDVENLTLARKDSEDRLNAVQLFAITKINIFD